MLHVVGFSSLVPLQWLLWNQVITWWEIAPWRIYLRLVVLRVATTHSLAARTKSLELGFLFLKLQNYSCLIGYLDQHIGYYNNYSRVYEWVLLAIACCCLVVFMKMYNIHATTEIWRYGHVWCISVCRWSVRSWFVLQIIGGFISNEKRDILDRVVSARASTDSLIFSTLVRLWRNPGVCVHHRHFPSSSRA